MGKELPDYLSQGHAVVTTFIDLYRLKSNMPGYVPVGVMPASARAQAVENAMAANLSVYIRHSGHFVPYVQMHEYEALLFSDPRAFESATDHQGSAEMMIQALRGVAGPEEVNGAQPPGVRLTASFPGYDKVNDGLLAAEAIGIPAMRVACPRFDGWLTSLGLVP